MTIEPTLRLEPPGVSPALQAYLLGSVEFAAALAFQRRLVYQVAGDRAAAALVLCEHPPLVTVGRHGSRMHVYLEPDELRSRRWQVHWVNRGGGATLHLPGQLAVYPILALDTLGLGLHDYLQRLQDVIVATLDDFGVRGVTRPDRPGIWVGPRLVADVGAAVRDWVTYYGVYFNINPRLDLYRLVSSGGPGQPPMTSLERERRGPLRPALVRERLLEHFASRFNLGQTTLFSDHPSLSRRASHDAIAARP